MKYGTFFSIAILAIFFTVTISAHESYGHPRQCGANEVRAPCGRQCEDRCNALRPRYCKDLICLRYDCRCKDGFVRNPYTDHCVHRERCAHDGCARGEIAGHCGKLCEGSCRRPFLPPSCEKTVCQGRECRCDLQGGFVRNKHTGECVRKESC